MQSVDLRGYFFFSVSQSTMDKFITTNISLGLFCPSIPILEQIFSFKPFVFSCLFCFPASMLEENV